MNLDKRGLQNVKDFIKYLNNNTTKKEKKSLGVLSAVDFTLLTNTIYIMLEENNNFEDILKSLGALTATTVILFSLIIIYIEKYNEEKEINRKRTRK